MRKRHHRLHVAAQLGVGDAGRGQTVVEVLDAEGDALAPLRQHVAALDGVHGGEEEAGLRLALVLHPTDDALLAVVQRGGQVAVLDVVHLELAVVLGEGGDARVSAVAVRYGE